MLDLTHHSSTLHASHSSTLRFLWFWDHSARGQDTDAYKCVP